MYRHDRVAAHAQIQSLSLDLASLQARLAEAERAREDALAELDRTREGIGDDPELASTPAYRRTQLGLRALALLTLVPILAAIGWVLVSTTASPLLTYRGVLNLIYHLRYGDGAVGIAAAGGILLLASPWLVLPWLGAVGLRRQRRWGWFLAVVSSVLYLPTPFMPVAAYAMVVLWSGRVRDLYFPRSH